MNLFLTGEKGAGKSTLIAKWAAREESRGGFLTVKSKTAFPGRISIHMLDVTKREEPDAQNAMFFCKECEPDCAIDGFNVLGVPALENARGKKLIIMDELGWHEEKSEAFKAAVLSVLDGSTPVIGVIQMADSPFLDLVKSRPKTRLITVTEENRDALGAMTLEQALWGYSYAPLNTPSPCLSTKRAETKSDPDERPFSGRTSSN